MSAHTGAGYIDFDLLHGIDEGNIGNFNRYGMWDYMKELKAEGLIRHYGFSFHSTPEHLEQLLTDHPDVEFVQLQINYADWEDPLICSRRIYEIATRHGKPVIVMEPVKGGKLAIPPQPVLLIGVVLVAELAGGLGELALTGGIEATVQDFTIGWPGLLLQIIGSYTVCKYL